MRHFKTLKPLAAIALFALSPLMASAEESSSVLVQGKANSATVDFLIPDGGFGVGLDYVFSYINVNAAYIFGKTDDNVTDNAGWQIGIGGNYRYNISKVFYVEGRAGIGYYHWSTKYKYQSGEKEVGPSWGNHHTTVATYDYEKNTANEAELYVSPRVGVHLFKNLSIVAGYRWDFVKFKFDKEHTNDYFTIGASWGF